MEKYLEIEQIVGHLEQPRDAYELIKSLPYSVEDKVKACLRLNGWDGSVQADGISAIQNLENLGEYIFPAGRAYLQQFGGRTLQGMKFPPWYPRGTHRTKDIPNYQYKVWMEEYKEIWQISLLEAFQIAKDELLIPIAREDQIWISPSIYLSETGNVYFWCEDDIGLEAPDLLTWLARIFGLEEMYYDPSKSQSFVDYDWFDRIEEEIHQGTYQFYAQKRFAKNGGIENPIMAKDSFTQWLLSLSEK